ncbi:MAG TPA: sigma-70 family RNA polymerase sigma factor [Pyrinomonadaceae bacterium]|jgi:RNA polymerase sigma factor (sigma-70 family)
MEQRDEDLLKACRSGDSAAWEALVNRFQRLIYAIPRRAGLDEDAASEVFQEVFTTLFEKLDDIEQPERLHAWLVTTARRKTWRLISRTRTAQRYTGHDEDESDAEINAVADSALLPDEALVQLEEQHRVRSALGSLDERCRKLLTLLFYRDEPPSYAEIAAATGTSEGSIGPTRARCLKKLTRLLEK